MAICFCCRCSCLLLITAMFINEVIMPLTVPYLGKITQYQLYHNEIPKYTGLSMYYDVGGLAPYSKHVFRVVACTRSGCSSSKQTKAYTQESQPEGFVTMDLRVDDERTVSVKWTVPEKPNGNMFFDVYFEGLFYADIGNIFCLNGHLEHLNIL